VSPSLRDRILAPSGRRGVHPEVAVILDHLRVGECPGADDVQWLRAAHGVNAVVSLQDDADLLHKNLRLSELTAAYRRHGVAFHRLPVADGDAAMLAARLPEALDLLHGLLSNGASVFLHCNAGLNRAPTVAIAYLHVHAGYALRAARDHVKARRACVPYWSLLVQRYGDGAATP
jgi:atypical dual specificity phosphatase